MDREINALQATLDRMNERLLSMTVRLDALHVSGSQSVHRYDNLVILEDDINKRIDYLAGVLDEIDRMIQRVSEERYRTLLIDRYMRFLTWDEIADDMSYCRANTHKLHGKALKEMREILSEIYDG